MRPPALPRQPLIAALEACRRARPGDTIITEGRHAITVEQLARRVDALRSGLRRRGLKPGDRVLAMLGNSSDHVVLFLAVVTAGLVWVPIAPDRRGAGLAHILGVTRPALVVAEPAAVPALERVGCAEVLVREPGLPILSDTAEPARHEPPHDPTRTCCILFTSGTTGPPKGVLLTERMLLVSACATGLACDAEDGDAFLVWEPLVHIGGAQLIPLALLTRVKLVLAERFSASRFWDQIRAGQVTKLHYLGGILDILLKQPETPDDRSHPVKLAFGAGCRPEAWHRFEARFGIPIREVYGMTEASSYTTVNHDGAVGAIGRPLPWFDVELLDDDGRPVAEGCPGEIVVRPLEEGLLTAGYLDDPVATAALFRDGGLRTGDLAIRAPDGNLIYAGRLRDSIRRRGELISAWEVEAAINSHPEVSESAVIAVPAEIGEEEILAYVLAKGTEGPAPETLAAWCAERLPKTQVPRFWCPVEEFPRTPSHRIDKKALPRDPEEMTDLAHRASLNRRGGL